MPNKKTVIRIPVSCFARERDKESAPLVIRRSYDMSADICRSGDTPGQTPVGFHVHGGGEISLLRCLAIGGGILLAVGVVCTVRSYRRALYYRRRYAKYYEEKAARKYQKKYMKEAHGRSAANVQSN